MSSNNQTAFQNISGAASNAYSSAADSISNLKNTMSSSMSDYSSPSSLGEASNDFLQSNSIIAKIAFILLVVILFNILLRLGIFLLNYFAKTNENPYLIKGLIDGSKAIRVIQDPINEDSVSLQRSDNKPTGIEYTWSVWLFINSVGSTASIRNDNNHFHHIFHKGTNTYSTDINSSNFGLSTLSNGPGVYLSYKNIPTIRVIMDTVSENQPAVIDVDNIPLKKWFNLMVRIQNTSLDIYINGVISAHSIMDNVPKQNFYDVFVCDHSGFDGSLSNLRYYASALNIFSINEIVARGPNLTPSVSASVGRSNAYNSGKSGFRYLSNLWYSSKL